MVSTDIGKAEVPDCKESWSAATAGFAADQAPDDQYISSIGKTFFTTASIPQVYAAVDAGAVQYI